VYYPIDGGTEFQVRAEKNARIILTKATGLRHTGSELEVGKHPKCIKVYASTIYEHFIVKIIKVLFQT
jgi:hypothetical protein